MCAISFIVMLGVIVAGLIAGSTIPGLVWFMLFVVLIGAILIG